MTCGRPGFSPRSVTAVAAALVLLLAGALFSPFSDRAEARVHAVATTGMIADAVRAVGGDRVDVVGLMGPGVDPHLYRASQGDVRRLASADIIFYNGLSLEGRMEEILERMARQKPTVAVSESIPAALLLEPEGFAGQYDPHIWFDVALWKMAVERIRDGLIQVDPEGEAVYRANAEAYLAELDELDAYIRRKVAELPAQSRVLVTAHDAFGYFGRAYGIEVVGLQGISTDTEVGLRDIQNLVAFLIERRIRAVFVESSVPRRALEAVIQGAASRGHTVAIGGELFSDALGEPGTPEGTYAGMMRYNIDTIVAALK
ncbi:MAG: manganese transporter [Firmicutes bacterium]|nr:manganese transporter [Bacillota bacterium]MBO2520422.1 manganese transporter [Bacillota bacterium]